MKTIEHVEYLLKQGKRPKELVELGFSKRTITLARRQLNKEKSEVEPIAPKNTAVQVLIEQWRREYNQMRPHSSLAYRPPAPFYDTLLLR